MDFKTALEHYRSGTASDAERKLVEDEIEKYQLIADQLDAQWEEAPAVAPAPQPEISQLRKRLRRRNAALVLTSLLLVAAVTIGALMGLAPVLKEQQDQAIDNKIEQNAQDLAEAESAYWDPAEQRFSDTVTDLHLTLQAYTELFHPDWKVNYLTSSRTNFAAYSLALTRWDSFKAESQFLYGTLVENELTLPEEFIRGSHSSNFFVHPEDPDLQDTSYYLSHNQYVAEKLKKLPDYMKIRADISFNDVMTMEELLEFSESWDLQISWSAISNPTQVDLGIDVFTGGLVLEGVNAYYREFYISSLTPSAEAMETHFVSLLQYSLDRMKEGKGIDDGTVQIHQIYEKTLAYVEENGVTCYGCTITASPQVLLDLMDSGLIRQIVTTDAWIDIG